MSMKMILDLDTGIDDTLAIMYALASTECELIGITATYGNVLMEQSVKNSLDILDFFGRSDVPVFLGEPHALATDGFEVLDISAFIHGVNGIGEQEIPASSRTADPRSAVDFIIEAAHSYGDQLVYVPTGPLTNLAHALRRDPSIAQKMGKVVLMGGALTTHGNVNAWTEANISQDPDAANEVFRSGVKATMVGLDVTLQTLLTIKETAEWDALGTPQAHFLAQMTNFYIKAYETTAPHLGGCGLHDPLAVAVAIDPTLVDTLALNMCVDVEGPTRGRTIGDPERINVDPKDMQVAVGVDTSRFLAELMSRTNALLKSLA